MEAGGRAVADTKQSSAQFSPVLLLLLFSIKSALFIARQWIGSGRLARLLWSVLALWMRHEEQRCEAKQAASGHAHSTAQPCST